jgi:hypothetical protein
MSLLDKVKDAAGKAAEQAKQAASIAQEKIDDSRLAKKAGDLYGEIGRLVVAQKRGNAPADIDAQIDAKVAEITDIESQIEANGAPASEGEGEGENPPPPPPAAS